MNTEVNIEIQRLLLEKEIATPAKTTIADVVMVLYKNYGIWIWVSCRETENQHNKTLFISHGRFIPTKRKNGMEIDPILYEPKYSITEAYESAILYTLKNLI